MGWLFTYGQTRSELIEHLTEGWKHGDGLGETKALKRYCSGNDLWVVFEQRHEVSNEEHTGEVTERFIVLFKMAPQRNYGWGYKDIEETMGPYERSCPLSFIDMCTEPLNEYSRNWREQVRQQWAERKAAREFARHFVCGQVSR